MSGKPTRNIPSCKSLMLAGATGLAFALSASPAAAQEESPNEVEEDSVSSAGSPVIIVQAQRREENAQDVPIAITAISQDVIEDQQIQTLEDISRITPSLNFGAFANTAQLNIRGVGFGSISGVGENAVAFHRDGVYISAPGALLLAQTDIGGVEVLRGPQGTLYGRNATGGVINISSIAPTDEFGVGGSLLYGNYDRFKQSAYVTGPLGPKARARIAFTHDERDGYVRNITTGSDLEGYETYSVNAALDLDITDRFVAEVRGFYGHEDNSAYTINPVISEGPLLPLFLATGQATLDPYNIAADFDSFGEREAYGGSLRLVYDLTDDIVFQSITGYTNFTSDANAEADGTAVPIVNNFRTFDVETFSQEFDLIGSTGIAEWVLGLFYYDDSTSINNVGDYLSFGENNFGITESRWISDTENRSYSVFGDLTLQMSDAFRIYGGLRYIRDELDSVETQTQDLDNGVLAFSAWATAIAGDPTADPALFGLDPTTAFAVLGDQSLLPLLFTKTYTKVAFCQNAPNKLRESRFTGRLGAQFDAADNVMTYAQYSHGYKSGGFGFNTCGVTFRPEQVDAFEVGLKSQLFERRLTLNFAAYYYDYTDLQYEEIISPNVFPRNADARIMGLEVEALARLTDDTTFDLGVSLIDSEYRDLFAIDANSPQLGTQNLDGNQLLRAPRYRLSAGLEHTFDLGRVGRLALRGEVQAVGKYPLRVFNAVGDIQQSYELYNAYLTYTPNIEGVTIRAFLKNASDEAVLVALVENATFRTGSYGVPRTFGVELSFDF